MRGYHRRRVADRRVNGLTVMIELRLRRLVRINLDFTRQTFNEQVPGLAGRYGRRTPGATALVIACAPALAGRGGAALSATIGLLLSRTSVLSTLMALPEPPPAVRRRSASTASRSVCLVVEHVSSSGVMRLVEYGRSSSLLPDDQG
ncbi:hypothetical protein [Nonomuraea fuscirosea]|uniref:hypothetical protein n=1 Tax=Nonomuraea fuscirosea TaxID=1291556 RepID=UPI0033DBF3AB